MKLDFFSLFKYPFNDKRFLQKLAICSLLILFPIINFLVVGYFMHIYQSGIRRKSRELPDWVWDLKFLKSTFVLGVAGTISGLFCAIPLFALVLMSIALSPLNDFMRIVGNVLLISTYVLAFCLIFFVPFVVGAYLEREEFLDILKFRKVFGYVREVIFDISKLYSFLILSSVASSIINNTFPFAMLLTTPFVVFISFVVFRGFGEIYPFCPVPESEESSPSLDHSVESFSEEKKSPISKDSIVKTVSSETIDGENDSKIINSQVKKNNKQEKKEKKDLIQKDPKKIQAEKKKILEKKPKPSSAKKVASLKKSNEEDKQKKQKVSKKSQLKTDDK